MQLSDLPTRFPIPFGNNAGASYIRSIPQAHVDASLSDAPASLYDGFPPETFLPLASGGIPPNGKDVNGILFQISAGLRWYQAGGAATFNSTFSTAVGGYPKGARLMSSADPAVLWISTADNNTTDPDGGSPANWVKSAPPGLTINGTDWKRVHADGWIEIGGILNPVPSGEASFTLTFPLGGFPNACLGVWGVPRNTIATYLDQTTFEEVSLSAASAVLFAQGTTSTTRDAAGGMRWKAEGY
jgi:hypothetical protein